MGSKQKKTKKKQPKLEDLDDDTLHQRELEAELKGEDITDELQAAAKKKKKRLEAEQAKQREQDEKDKQNMNRMVMSNKNRRLYTKMLKQQRAKKANKERLEAKRRAIKKESRTKKAKAQ